jgi:hypothetical protein
LRTRLAIATLGAAAAIAAGGDAAFAGGGPENVFLLVNANSDSSKTIANHYIALRKIPPSHVLYVDWQGNLEGCSGKSLRDQILMPAFKAIEQRRLAAQIDYLVYSADFPWRIDLRPLFPDEEFRPEFRPVGSLTGCTYLAAYLATDKPNPALVMPTANWYVPAPDEKNVLKCGELGDVPSRGFRFRYYWDRTGEPTKNPEDGQRYFLSVSLGITQGRGNTEEEIINYLRRAASADGTRPPGTIYFMRNKDVRSAVRHGCFEEVVEAVRKQGVLARILEGRIPNGAKDVMGIMAGIAEFDMPASGNVVLPGAICEHLTSAGGNMSSRSFQTPLSEFLRHGAAGASGTVVEPMAIQAKFPLPSLQLHYVRGCSLAEAFYQSVSGPYQLLIVGDPLCQPWALIPKVTVKGIEPGQQVKGSLTITPEARPAAGRRIGMFDFIMDGRLVARTLPGRSLTFDTAKLADGFHELRVVAVQDDKVETQGRSIVPFVVRNQDAAFEFSLLPKGKLPAAAVLRASVRQPGATAIVIRQNSREVARVEGEAGEVEVSAAMLGRGPTSLQAHSEGPLPAVSAPIALQIEAD